MIVLFLRAVDLWWLVMEDLSLTYRNVNRWFYHPSKLLTCGDPPWSISPWLTEMWIDGLIIRPSRWLVVTHHGGILINFRWCGSMIVLFLRAVDLWWFAIDDFSLTYTNVDRWSYYISESLTGGDSPCRIFPWFIEIWIDDPTIRPSRWLVVTRLRKFLLRFWKWG